MAKTLLIGSGNRDKARELRRLLEDSGWDVKSLSDFDAVPEPKYIFQMCALLDCGPFDWAALCIGLHFRDIRLLRITPNRRKQSRMLKKVADWREQHLVGGVENRCSRRLGPELPCLRPQPFHVRVGALHRLRHFGPKRGLASARPPRNRLVQ